MEEPSLLTDEERAFIQHLYYKPDNRAEPEPPGALQPCDEPLNQPRTRYPHSPKRTIGTTYSNGYGNRLSLRSGYYETLSFTYGNQAVRAPVAMQERVKQLEAEIARLKIRLTDAIP